MTNIFQLVLWVARSTVDFKFVEHSLASHVTWRRAQLHPISAWCAAYCFAQCPMTHAHYDIIPYRVHYHCVSSEMTPLAWWQPNLRPVTANFATDQPLLRQSSCAGNQDSISVTPPMWKMCCRCHVSSIYPVMFRISTIANTSFSPKHLFCGYKVEIPVYHYGWVTDCS